MDSRRSPRPQETRFIGTKCSFNGWADVPTDMRDRCGLRISRGSLVVVDGIAREEFGVADEAIINSTAHTIWEPAFPMSLHCFAAVRGILCQNG
jgi:hypothetical protein